MLELGRMVMQVHSSLTPERILAAVEETMLGMANTGFCVKCGDEREGCEPDARRYPCESCDERAVYGAEELMLMGCAG